VMREVTDNSLHSHFANALNAYRATDGPAKSCTVLCAWFRKRSENHAFASDAE